MKQDIYQLVTDKTIAKLEAGVIPWESPYFVNVGLPRNFVSKKAYQGINLLLLASQRFSTPWFLTYLQAKELGGHVRKGEHGFLVIKCGTYLQEVESEDSETESV